MKETTNKTKNNTFDRFTAKFKRTTQGSTTNVSSNEIKDKDLETSGRTKKVVPLTSPSTSSSPRVPSNEKVPSQTVPKNEEKTPPRTTTTGEGTSMTMTEQPTGNEFATDSKVPAKGGSMTRGIVNTSSFVRIRQPSSSLNKNEEKKRY